MAHGVMVYIGVVCMWWCAGISIATAQQYSRETGDCCLQALVPGLSF